MPMQIPPALFTQGLFWHRRISSGEHQSEGFSLEIGSALLPPAARAAVARAEATGALIRLARR